MSRPTLFGASLVLLTAASSAVADPTVTVSGQVRVREEVRHEIFAPADPAGDDSFDEAHLRSRIRADASVNDELSVVVELQDVRIFGSEGSTVADTEGIDLKRGALVVKPAGRDVTIQAGRWVMAYGDQRLVGDLEWLDQGRSYDGVHLSYAPGKGFIDAFAVRVRETLEAKDDLHFGGVYGGATVASGLDVEGYLLGLRDSMAPNSQFATIGSRVAIARGQIDGAAEVALQAGDVQAQDHLAFAAAVKGGVTLPGSAAIRFGGEVAYASGDGDPTDGESRTFQTLFPTNHVHYGAADLAAWQNLIELRAGVRVKSSPASWVSLDFYQLRLADPAGGWFNAAGALVRPGDPDASATLGNEVDLIGGWKPIDGLSLQAGVAAFFGGGFVQDTGGGGNAVFAYALASATF